VKKPEEKEGLNIGLWIIIKWFLENKVRWYSLDSSGLGWGPVEGCCEH
jgi:hypothetical protein